MGKWNRVRVKTNDVVVILIKTKEKSNKWIETQYFENQPNQSQPKKFQKVTLCYSFLTQPRVVRQNAIRILPRIDEVK